MRPSTRPSIPRLLASMLLPCLAVLSCSGGGATDDAARIASLEATIAAERQQYEETIAVLRQELSQARAENIELQDEVDTLRITASEEQIRSLEKRVAMLKSELQRYEGGEGGDGGAPQPAGGAGEPAAASTAPGQAPRRQGCCVVHHPKLLQAQSTVTVSGHISNEHFHRVAGRAVIELLSGDGSLVDTKEVEMVIDPGDRRSYGVTFSALLVGPAYTPRVRFVEGQ